MVTIWQDIQQADFPTEIRALRHFFYILLRTDVFLKRHETDRSDYVQYFLYCQLIYGGQGWEVMQI